jgi:hypothetical protein
MIRLVLASVATAFAIATKLVDLPTPTRAKDMKPGMDMRDDDPRPQCQTEVC